MYKHGIKSVSAVWSVINSLHQDFVSPYPTANKNLRKRRLISRFRCGCHGLHVDTGRFVPAGHKVHREQLVRGSDAAEDENHCVLDCAAYILSNQEQL